MVGKRWKLSSCIAISALELNLRRLCEHHDTAEFCGCYSHTLGETMTMPELPNRTPMQPAAKVADSEGGTSADETTAASRKPAKTTVLAAAAGLVAGVLLGVSGTLIAGSIAGANVSATAPPAATATATATVAPTGILKNAVTTCHLPNDEDAKLGDNDTSLTLNGSGKREFMIGLPISLMDCILDSAQTPEYVRSQMGNTRALDGTQHGTWGASARAGPTTRTAGWMWC